MLNLDHCWMPCTGNPRFRAAPVMIFGARGDQVFGTVAEVPGTAA